MSALPQLRRLSITIRIVLPALAGLTTLTRLSLGKLAWSTEVAAQVGALL